MISTRLNIRLLFLGLLLAGLAAGEIAREHRPSFLRPGLRLYAYVANSGDGTVTVVDLVSLGAKATIPVGPAPASLRALPAKKQVWGVSTDGGYVWMIDAAKGGGLAATVQVGAQPLGFDFSPSGRLLYATASGSNALVVIDASSAQIVGRARTGRHPGPPRVTPDGNTVLVPNRDDGTLQLFDAHTLAPLGSIALDEHPEQIDVLPDGSMAFLAGEESRVSSVDLRRRVLVANLQLEGKPGEMILKPDGGELYVTVPAMHTISIVDTASTEVAESKLVGLMPTGGTVTAGGAQLFLSDSAAGRVVPIAMASRSEGAGIPAGRGPGASCLDPSGELLLVANRDSNDLAVIGVRTGNLLTLVPVGSQPSDVAALLF